VRDVDLCMVARNSAAHMYVLRSMEGSYEPQANITLKLDVDFLRL